MLLLYTLVYSNYNYYLLKECSKSYWMPSISCNAIHKSGPGWDLNV